MLVSLYEAARRHTGSASDFEVVVVSWDEQREQRERYAKATGMQVNRPDAA